MHAMLVEDLTLCMAEVAEEDGVPVLKFKQWRKKGEIIPEVRRESEG